MNSVIPAGTDWHSDFQEWLRAFLAVFKRSEQRCWAPLYLEGLLGSGARKSVEPMAERVCHGQTQQLHHFVSTSTWPTAPLEQVLRETANALVGIKRQHCGVLGKQANCQVLVSLTFARTEVPVPIALQLYLPEDWAQDEARRAAAKVPESIIFEPKGNIALAQIDAALADGVQPNTLRRTLIRAIKARWACEQAHQQRKDELGLDHYEGRSWLGLHHHVLLTMMAFTYLQHRRLASQLQAGKKQKPMLPVRHLGQRYRRYAAPF